MQWLQHLILPVAEKPWWQQWEAWTAIGTVALAIITLFLAIATFLLFATTVWMGIEARRTSARQAREVKESLELSRRAADAAQRSAAAIPLIERAYVYVTVSPPPRSPIDGSAEVNFQATITFKNHGNTPAELNQHRGYLIVSDQVPQKLLSHADSATKLPPGLVIGRVAEHHMTLDLRIPNADWQRMTAVSTHLYAVGQIDYTDVLGNQRSTGFCWQFQFREFGMLCIPVPSTPLNFVDDRVA
jgi:hypothetical protein